MIYICGIQMYKKWPERPDIKTLNVTSSQKLNNEARKFSPFYLREFKGYSCFENFYQSLKFFEDMTEEQFLKRREDWKTYKPKKRDAWSKKKVLYTLYNGKKRDYVQTRKEIYYPMYKKIILDLDIIKNYKNKDLIVVDFDGPRENKMPVCLPFSKELFNEKINDIESPFGHGYIVALILSENE